MLKNGLLEANYQGINGYQDAFNECFSLEKYGKCWDLVGAVLGNSSNEDKIQVVIAEMYQENNFGYNLLQYHGFDGSLFWAQLQ